MDILLNRRKLILVTILIPTFTLYSRKSVLKVSTKIKPSKKERSKCWGGSSLLCFLHVASTMIYARTATKRTTLPALFLTQVSSPIPPALWPTIWALVFTYVWGSFQVSTQQEHCLHSFFYNLQKNFCQQEKIAPSPQKTPKPFWADRKGETELLSHLTRYPSSVG